MTISIPEQYQSLKTKLETIVKKVISPQEIPANSDLNDYTEAGLYYCKLPNTDLPTLSNAPDDVTTEMNGFSLLVENTNVYDNGVKQTLTTFKKSNTYVRNFWTDNNDTYKDTGWRRLQYGDWEEVASYQNNKIKLYTNGTIGMIHISGEFTITCSANTDYTLATMSTDYTSFSSVSNPASYGAKNRNQLIFVKGGDNKIIFNSSTAISNASVGIYCTIFYRLATPIY